MSDTCIIVVGSTGTGKSSTIAKMTGTEPKVGPGSWKVTDKPEIYNNTLEEDDAGWVDTVGWDDEELENEETFKDILKFIEKNNITKVKAVIWNVCPSQRTTAQLKGQAKLINLFKEKDIWNNVIIVVKKTVDIQLDGQGAVWAALAFSKSNEHRLCTGYGFLDTTMSYPPEAIRAMNLKTDEEVRQTLKDLLSKVGPPVQVVFNNKVCVNCSEAGDPRLLSAYCHMEPIYKHQGEVESFHPGGVKKCHRSKEIKELHPSGSQQAFFSFCCCCCSSHQTPRHKCCGKKEGTIGCTKLYWCCKKPQGPEPNECSERFTCCERMTDDVRVAGCTQRYSACKHVLTEKECHKVCKKCEKDWGTPTADCFRTDHVLVNQCDQVKNC